MTTILTFYFLSIFIVYPISKYTTIGNQVWFGEFISKIQERLSYNKLSDLILKLSYSKLFICRPCHSFWLSWLINSVMTTVQISFVLSLLTYFIIKQYDNEDEELDDTSEE